MHVAKLEIQGNSLVGLYVVPMDDVVLVGHEVPTQFDKQLKEIFDAEIVRITIAGTSLLGVFVATNGKTLVIPNIVFEHEEAALIKAGVEYTKIESNHTCLGNNIAASKKGILVNPEFESDAVEQIAQAFSLPIKTDTVDGAPTIGSYIVCNDNYGLASHEFSDKQIDELSKHLGVKLSTGTVNLGSTNIASGIAVNNSGFIIGEISGGPEVINADQALGFLGDDDE